MRFASFLRPDGSRAVGRVDADRIEPLIGIDEIGPATTLDVLRNAEPDAGNSVSLASSTLLPVVAAPRKIICVGLNYHAHIGESGRDVPTYPVLFTKFASSLIAHGAAIELPPESQQVDYEAELAVVIGAPARRVSRADAHGHVLGYTIANDVTMRDFQYRTHQWLPGKAWDRATPLGPVLVTPDEVDPADLDITLRLNGTELQSSNTSRLIFDVGRLIEVVSEFTSLLPGDVILTGTPGGVGFRRDPQVFLADGDIVEVEIAGLGVLRNPVRREVTPRS